MSATVEINDAVFCQSHLAEVCEPCAVDMREENDGFYGFDSIDRQPIGSLQASADNDGIYHCDEHNSASCNQCFSWKKQIMKLMRAAKAG